MALLADLHNHSCLSPCGSLDLSPRALVELAAGKGVEVLALTDHNSSLNCPAFAKVCAEYNVVPIFGMEATTAEEIHVLCLFGNLDAALAWSDYVYEHLPPFINNPERTGDQVYVDEDDNIEGEVEHYLISGLDISLDDIGPLVKQRGGIVIPAHVDRQAFSMTSQLGIIVQGPWAALELVRLPSAVDTLGYPLITSS
ncbi:MAG: PHP domain-containing protein, partial [Treponema sp.]|nr:PHP domain-containing protein [Treponema sp.]